MKNNLLLCSLALLTAGMVLAEPTHLFKLTGFNGHADKTVAFCYYATDSEVKPVEEFVPKAIAELNSAFLEKTYWNDFEVSSWADYYPALESYLSAYDRTVKVPESGEFLFHKYDAETTATYVYFSFLLCPEGLKAGKPYTLYRTACLPKLESPDEHIYPAVDFADVVEIQSGKFKSDPVPEPAFALVALIGLLAVCRKK